MDPEWLEEHPLLYALKDRRQITLRKGLRDYLVPEKIKLHKHQIYSTSKYLAGFVNLGFIANHLVKNDETI